ncbi:MAG: saccharopine dehydrogenase NADP-binding domain-containing protein [Elusimicrobia bacterium]|nr:saccharopine dehydrogenase NADP-binding domain-containing protein [Elusimicrobiota bacterium]
MMDSAARRLLVYGATGYSGTLVAEEAARRGLRPILAGRDPAKVAALGQALGFDTRVFPCDAPGTILPQLDGVGAVLHCAGPFSATSRPMFKACLQAGVHYLDIAGEIRVFERILSRPEACRERGIVAIPGVGFDVVPTDCLAAALKRELPEATHLTLAIHIAGPPSPGSFKTLTEGLHAGGLVRKDGRLMSVPAAYRTRVVDFPLGRRKAVMAPWADLASAFYSTGIPNIETYICIAPTIVALIRGSKYLKPLLATPAVQRLIQRGIERTVRGPTRAEREKHRYEIWAEAVDGSGRRAVRTAVTPNGYSVTADAALRAACRVLEGTIAPGAYAPSQAFGADFLSELVGVSA